jgi:glycosyltransferase involved in cell wall biosynthesis
MPIRHFLVPGSLTRTTGGSVFDLRIVAGMRAMGEEITVHELPDDYPVPSAGSLARLVSCLESVPSGSTVIIDGLISGCVPEILSKEAARLRLVSLVHHPLADETGLSKADVSLFRQTEAKTLSIVDAVIVTSGFTKQRLQKLFSIEPESIFVVTPGTDPNPIAVGSHGEGLSLLCVASLTRRKGYPILVEALSGLVEHTWRLVCVGSRALDPIHAQEIEGLIADHGLANRITLKSDLSAEDLWECYDQADLFVFPSHYEGFGMVISEAITRALPIVTTTGGALRNTAPNAATLFATPGDVGTFREALRRVICDSELRSRLRDGAKEARDTLPTWDHAARQFMSVLRQIEGLKGQSNG